MKPDGWHTYHICDGLLRELTWIGMSEALCPWCGEWFTARIDKSAKPTQGTYEDALEMIVEGPDDVGAK